MTAKHKTREQWLNAAVKLAISLFATSGKKVPVNLRVSCGFPSRNALGSKKRRIGECWSDKASEGKVFEIFISPVLSKPFEVFDTLVHEMVHATVGLECGHRGEFRVVATAVGLEGKMTSCGAGPELKKRINELLPKLGAYPHEKLDKMTNGRKRDVCRLVKAACPACGYTIRTTRKWLEVGLPTCPCGTEMERAE